MRARKPSRRAIKAAIDFAAPIGTGSAPRQRVTRKASGARGLYDSAEWRARSSAHLGVHPHCVRCGEPAVLCDHEPPVRPDDRDGVLHGPIRSMCRRCHFSRSRVTQGETGVHAPVKHTGPVIRGCTPDGMPRDRNHPWWKER
jgi:hypothetical protein